MTWIIDFCKIIFNKTQTYETKDFVRFNLFVETLRENQWSWILKQNDYHKNNKYNYIQSDATTECPTKHDSWWMSSIIDKLFDTKDTNKNFYETVILCKIDFTVKYIWVKHFLKK